MFFLLEYLITLPALLILFGLAIWFEHTDSRGLAVFTTLAAAVISKFYFNLTSSDMMYGALAYIGFGTVWSFYRYRHYVKSKVAEFKQKVEDYDWDEIRYARELQYLKDKIHPKKNIDTIIAWIVVWPFSLVENLISDIIDLVETYVRIVLKKIYEGIYNSAIKDL